MTGMINLYAPDPNAKATMIKALEHNTFNFCFNNKEQGADVMVFTRQMITVFCYIDQLQGEPAAGLTVDMQKKNYFKMYRKEWQFEFKKSHD